MIQIRIDDIEIVRFAENGISIADGSNNVSMYKGDVHTHEMTDYHKNKYRRQS